MNNFIKENWFKLTIIVIILVISGASFYWYELRPSEIRKKCYDISLSGSILFKEVNYKNCLMDNGLEK